LNSTQTIKLLALYCMTPAISFAQDAWQFGSSVTAMTGHYADSLTMNNQHGVGVRMSGEKDKKWGITAGLQSTRIDMTPITQVSKQDQDNWLLSAHVHVPTHAALGLLTFQLDTHKANNDASQSISSNVRAIAPQVTWLSYTQPFKLELSHASSNYKNTPATIHQRSLAIAYGFTSQTNWVQVRSYAINNLDPLSALGQSSTRATDISLTHVLKKANNWVPASITVGLESGKRIYVVDMTTQTLYNLPMINEGSEKIAANWKLSKKTEMNFQFSKTRYFSDVPTAPSAHRFTLDTLSAQIATAW
jgi:hypothetical protein